MLTIGLFPLLIAGFVVKCTSPGPVIFWSQRIGRKNKPFMMAKFRTMWVDTPNVATHLLSNPRAYLTSVGKWYRKFSIDEIPQFWNVIKGDMSIVGPRPALYNQDDLIILRTQKKVHLLRPGLTGWAQVCGRDTLSVQKKVEYDEYYLLHRKLSFDFRIIVLTICNVLSGKDVYH